MKIKLSPDFSAVTLNRSPGIEAAKRLASKNEDVLTLDTVLAGNLTDVEELATSLRAEVTQEETALGEKSLVRKLADLLGASRPQSQLAALKDNLKIVESVLTERM
jgi:hypothetical protein